MLTRRQTAADEPQEFVLMDGRLQLSCEVGEVRDTLGGGFLARGYRFKVPLSKIAWRGHVGVGENGVGLVEVVTKGDEAFGIDVAVGLDAGKEDVENLGEGPTESVSGPRFVVYLHGGSGRGGRI